jgi:hypothetical protein
MILSIIIEESLKDQALKYMAVLVDGDQLYLMPAGYILLKIVNAWDKFLI